jgi:hypothetical protein
LILISFLLKIHMRGVLLDPYLPISNSNSSSFAVDDRVTSLREHLLALLGGSESRQQLESVVAVCHSLALTHIRSKRSAWKMMDFHGLKLPDLAYDCIADLFQRGDDGSLPELRDYFAVLDIENADSPEILVHLRRIVFAKANKRLSQLVAETDSYFFRTTRNIRNALKTTGKFIEIDRFGEPTLLPQYCDPLFYLPMYLEEELAQLVWSNYSSSTNIPTFVERLYQAVSSETSRCRLIPLLSIVALIKEATGKEYRTDEGRHFSDELTDDAVHKLITDARKETDRKFRKAYVAKGKVSPEDFAAYLNAIESLLTEQMSADDRDNLSLFSSLQQELPELAEPEYRDKHRARIEYMARHMREKVARYLR